MAKNKTEIHVTTVFDGELDATDVFVSLISQKYGKTNTKEHLAKKKDLKYNEDEVQKSQYLFVFAGGLLALFVVFVIMYMAGIGQWVCIGFGVIAASVLVWATFRMNAKYGEWGLMKLQALRRHPRYIINRRRFLRLFSLTSKKRSV